MDCILFDHIESPVFHRVGNTDILPIEGVVGAVEINFGVSTTYQKIIKDAEKLHNLAKLTESRLPRVSILLSHLPLSYNANNVTTEQLTKGLTFHRAHDGKPLLLIFAERVNGDLQEVAKRIMEHNKKVGIRNSIDGIFILQQGFALHVDNNKTGWTTQRMEGSEFRFLPVSQGHVLIKMQSVILKNLYQIGKTHPGGFDAYINQTGQGPQEISTATLVSDQQYINQKDVGSIIVNG
jgi:hypothetical protein